MSSHRHTCPHGTWTCHADDCGGTGKGGQCGTCLRIGMTDGSADPAKQVLCTACDEPAMCPFGVVQVVPLCASCHAKIEEQLRKGKFLG
jgi:hypothetical protein